jgi:hypothetical protein
MACPFEKVLAKKFFCHAVRITCPIIGVVILSAEVGWNGIIRKEEIE